MRLSFHQRILLILICLGAVPTAVAILGWGLTIRSTTRAPGARDAIEGVAESGRLLLHTIDSTRLEPAERRALASHATKLNTAIGQFQRADTFSRYYYAGLVFSSSCLAARSSMPPSVSVATSPASSAGRSRS